MLRSPLPSPDKETVDSALDDMKLDVKEYPLHEDVYKAVYSVKITAYKPG